MTTENERSFEESVNSLSDSAKVDYERREAEVMAISDKVKPLWVRLEQIYERKKYLETSKWMPIVYILVVLGAAVNIFLRWHRWGIEDRYCNDAIRRCGIRGIQV